MISGILAFLAGAMRIFNAVFGRKNEKDMIANKVAAQDAAREDANAALESRAAAGDPAALKEIQRDVAE